MTNANRATWDPVEIELTAPGVAPALLHHRHNSGVACSACEIVRLRATLELALGVLAELIGETGPVYDPIATAEARARAVRFLDAALEAGKEAGG